MKYMRAFLYFLSTLVMYLGIPLLGWGLDDLAAFFSLPARAAYGVLMLVFALAVGWQAMENPEGISGGKGDSAKTLRRQSIVGAAMSLFLLAVLFLLPFADRRAIASLPESPILRWIGAGLTTFAFILIFWSGQALGKYYSVEVTIQKDHRLITCGLYRYIRNPRYLGLIAAALGMPLQFACWAGLLAAPILVGILLFRIHDEEQLLHHEFGAEWEEYCRHSWRLLPLIY